MKMSDKDFDQLFNSKLEDFEIEPSAKVWSNIDNELSRKPGSKKSAIPFMRIAAAIVVIMGVSLFLIRPHSEKVTLHGHDTNVRNEAVVVKPIEPLDMPSNDVVVIASGKNVSVSSLVKPVNHSSKYTEEASMTVKSTDTVQYITAVKPVEVTNQQNDLIKQSLGSAMSLNAAALPNDNKVLTPVKLIVSDIQVQKNISALKRGRIHSLGDLLNVVIAKVDKREDKIIEFTNSGDDDTFNITSVNLGLIKVKKEN